MRGFFSALIRLLSAALILSANTACAASFDCAKAGTEVEKMICADPELSKLDEELAQVYSKGIKNIRNTDQLRIGQRGWLKRNRGRCSDSICVKEAYQQRIEEIENILSVDFVVPSVAYPPYPDKWHLEFPLSLGESGLGFSLFKMDNGSYLVFFTKGAVEGQKITSGRGFFEQSAYGEAQEKSAFYKLNHIWGERRVELTDGSKISVENMDHRLPQRCPQSLNYHYVLEYPDGRRVRKSFFHILNQPEQKEIEERCASTNKSFFYEKVRSIGGDVWPLDDGGFLLVDRKIGVVLRFDRNFQTKSDLIGRRIFVADTEQLEKLGVNEFEDMNYQHMQDAVYKLLTN